MKTSKEIKKILNKQWNNLEQMWLLDSKYNIISDSKLAEIVDLCSVKNYKAITNIWECDKRSLVLHANIRKIQYDAIILNNITEERFAWAFGEAIQITNGLFSGVHALNIAITDTGIKLIEPKTDRIFKPTNEDIFFVKF